MKPRALLPALRVGRVLVVLVLAAGGCAPHSLEQDCAGVACAPCAPALSLRVLVPAGQPVPEVTLGSGQGSCAPSGGVVSCTLVQQGAGHYALDVQAPGYQAVHLEQDVAPVQAQGCCSCGYEARVVDVRLDPL
jgi:hypothetical protein